MVWEDAAAELDRAHVIDRASGGLDGPQNLRPLCRRCHDAQPLFGNGDEVDAGLWFGRGRAPTADRLAEQLVALHRELVTDEVIEVLARSMQVDMDQVRAGLKELRDKAGEVNGEGDPDELHGAAGVGR